MINEVKSIKITELKNLHDKYQNLQEIKFFPRTANAYKALEHAQGMTRIMDVNGPRLVSAEAKHKLARLEKKVERFKKRELRMNNWEHSLEKTEYENNEDWLRAVENATTLPGMGITPAAAYDILTENGQAPMLDLSDLVTVANARNYSDQSGLVAVAQSEHLPEKSIIEYTSWHLNDGFTGGRKGIDCRYTFITPVADIPNEVIAGQTTPDSLRTLGKFTLSPNSWILYQPYTKKDWDANWAYIKKYNPNVRVLGIDPKVSRYQAVCAFISQLGYRLEKTCQNGWENQISNQQFLKLANNLGQKAKKNLASEPIAER